MIVACASFSSNVTTVQKIAFMVVASTSDVKNGAGTVEKQCRCSFVGLQGQCSAYCGTNTKFNAAGTGTTDVPNTDPAYSCETASVSQTGKRTSSVVVYKTQYDLGKCGDTSVKQTAEGATECAKLSTCITGGNVTMAFAVIGCIGALFAMVIFAWRMNGDGVCAKLMSVIFSSGTFIACTTAFAAFQPCATMWHEISQTAATAAALNPAISNIKVGVAPGIGGAMAVTSFVFFIYVMLMSIFIPGSAPAAADAGLDATAPKV